MDIQTTSDRLHELRTAVETIKDHIAMTPDLANDLHWRLFPTLARDLQRLRDEAGQAAIKRVSLPALPDVTVGRWTFWDNGLVKGKVRFALTAEMWTGQDPNAIRLTRPDHKTNIPLYSGEITQTKVRRLVKSNSISRAYGARLMSMAVADPNVYFGLMMSKASGTAFVDGAFVVVSLTSERPDAAVIIIGPDEIELPGFTDKNFDGAKFKGAAKYQSRLDRIGMSDNFDSSRALI